MTALCLKCGAFGDVVECNHFAFVVTITEKDPEKPQQKSGFGKLSLGNRGLDCP
jgi:hypothetical protein